MRCGLGLLCTLLLESVWSIRALPSVFQDTFSCTPGLRTPFFLSRRGVPGELAVTVGPSVGDGAGEAAGNVGLGSSVSVGAEA